MKITEKIETSLVGCARCGEKHTRVVFVKLDHPVVSDNENLMFPHWTNCPTNGQPILMFITDSETC